MLPDTGYLSSSLAWAWSETIDYMSRSLVECMEMGLVIYRRNQGQS
jgi:hypothetical protein